MRQFFLLAALAVSLSLARPAPVPREPPSLTLSPRVVDGLQIALFLENAEASYLKSASSTMVAKRSALEAVMKQDEVHRQALRGILAAAGTRPILPCNTTFTAYNETSLLRVGNILSAARAGAALDLLMSLPSADFGLAPGVAAMAAGEARHQQVLGAAPFDAVMPASWAVNVVRRLSHQACPTFSGLPNAPRLDGSVSRLDNRPMVRFHWKSADLERRAAVEPLFLSWLGRPGGPAHTPLRLLTENSGEWDMPGGMGSLVFVALTTQAQFTTYEDLAKYTLAGPAVLSV
ncbi:hypothetical protein B0T11DRAFT_294581 [Plectosphaerella cucumerina]|uniref:DUF4439 domain-containing protein n=1 Tax=Plectosphaerella cucumerina TaxID=40658 RepID=A0A8K0TRJ4_9PEZI|nr:hypothetical protein B0T11DRAFT_294581 [Plectosphaerella cucumerina]